MQMSKTDPRASYLIKIPKIYDQYAVAGEKVKSEELVPITLNGFSYPWQCFVRCVCPQDKLSTFEKPWDDFIQEKMSLDIVVGIEEEEYILDLITNQQGQEGQ